MSQSETKTVLITGISSGIGQATAFYLAEKGYSVIGTSRSVDRLTILQAESSKRKLPITTVALDINTAGVVEEILPPLIREHGGIDVLVNNAGYGLWGPSESLSLKELRAQFETNFFAPFRLIKAVLPCMIEKGKGTIVNISSIEGRIGTPFNGAYAASKFALEGLSESLQLELRPLGIHVTVVEPGLFRTSFFNNQVIAEGTASEDLPYRPYLERYRTRRRKFDWLAAEPIKVAQVIHKIVRSRRPGFRYAVGPEARLGLLAARFLPERIFRARLSRATLG